MSKKEFKGGPRGPMGHGPNMIGEKAKNFKGTMGKLIKYLSKYWIGFLIVIIFAIGSATFSIVGPKILGNATTEIFEGLMSKVTGAGSGIDFNKIAGILLFLLTLYVISAFFSFIQGIITTNITQKVAYNMRKQISEKISKMPMKYFDGRPYGEILSRVTNDIDTLSQSLNQSMTQVITAITTVIGVLIMMFSISWIMAIITLLILPLSMILISLTVKKSQGFFRQQQEFLGEVNGQVEEVYSGHNIVKAFNNENQVIDDFNECNEKLYSCAWKSQFLSGMMMPIMNFVGNLGYVMVAIVGGYLAINGTIKVGDIQSFIQYVRQFNQPIAQVAQVANMLQSTAAAAERVFEFLAEEEEEQKARNPKVKKEIINGKEIYSPATSKDIIGNVEFKNVSFGYNDDKIIIKDFSAKVKQGQKIAIVGPTGAGKTTMIKLLMRFYDVTSGEILVDGYNVKDFDRSQLREAFGMVLQDTWLFNGTIKDNIKYGKLDATDEEIIQASKAAKVHSFVKALPDGYNMELNEEATNISQGQKQLLTIARAILADPKILILDEATSSVDTRTEIKIQEAMDNLMKGRTSFIIAHRLSTIKNADLILVMKDGNIIEQGNHNELMEQQGFYYNLYNSQFEKTSA